MQPTDPTAHMLNPPDPPALMSFGDVAARIGVSYKTLWKLRREGKLPKPVTLDPPEQWSRADIENWLRTNRRGA